MPYVSVLIDVDEVIGDATDDELREELESRRRKREGDRFVPEARISAPDAKVALDEAAHRLRKINRFDLAYKLDEIRNDYF